MKYCNECSENSPTIETNDFENIDRFFIRLQFLVSLLLFRYSKAFHVANAHSTAMYVCTLIDVFVNVWNLYLRGIRYANVGKPIKQARWLSLFDTMLSIMIVM